MFKKYTEEDVKKWKLERDNGKSYSEISRIYKVDRSTVKKLLKENKKFIGEYFIADVKQWAEYYEKVKNCKKVADKFKIKDSQIIWRGLRKLGISIAKHQVLMEEIKRRIKEKHGNTVVLDESTYTKVHAKCRFIDKDFGEFWTKPVKVFAGHGHDIRGRLKIIEKKTLSLDKVKQRIKEKHGDMVVLDESTYINTKIKAKFIDKDYGEWWAFPRDIFVGHGHDERGLLKAAKHSNNSYILYHWKTGEEVVCVASYEKKTIEYLNFNRINYIWQKAKFNLPPDGNGKVKTFRPDCYLSDQDLWIEIKGYFRKDAREKWEWFHKEYPNSELWDKNKLKELKIL